MSEVVPVAAVLPARDRTVLHESARTRVSRLVLAGRTVIRKELLGPDWQERLGHERAMLERLREVAGVAQLLETPLYPGSIVVADVGGASLVGLAKPLAVDELIDLGLELAKAVAGMHRRGVMHRDITPANIVISRDGAPCLVDFALAASVAEMRPEFLTTARSRARWRIWPPSKPGAPAGQWISAPTCTRWARRCMSWPPVRRRSVGEIRCDSLTIIWPGCRCPRRG
jgi:serine/threonine protein kinase